MAITEIAVRNGLDDVMELVMELMRGEEESDAADDWGGPTSRTRRAE